MNILIVDDERELTDALSAILKQNGYFADCAYDGEEGLFHALSGIYDLVILDVMMPKKDGFTVLKEIRAKKNDVPVIMLTAKSEVSDKIDGLNCGADDYIAKPFDAMELIARIKALLRRKIGYAGNLLSFGNISLDKDYYELICGNKKIQLGKKEFAVMEILIANGDKCVGKETLAEKVWGFDSDAEYNMVEVYVSFLRKKLAAINSDVAIKSLRGIGYALEVTGVKGNEA